LKILIVTQYFYPENFRINDLALELSKRNHNITVLTAIPNYPSGKFFDGYGYIKKNRDSYKGIRIYRAPIIPRGNGSNFRLSLNYISYVFGAIFTSLFIMNRKYDVIFVFEPSPITVGLPAVFMKRLKGIPICFWVLDLWPESVLAAGKIKSVIIQNILTRIVKLIYHNCDKILVSSKGFVGSIVSKGIGTDIIEFSPQWAEPVFKPKQKNYTLLNELIPSDSFKIMFAGNIGEAQDFPSILEAAKIIKYKKNIHWIIIGGGRRTEWVKNKIADYELGHCFHMLGSYPLEKMPEFYALADAMLFSLKDEHIFSITIPAKVQTYLACGKPVLAMVNGESRSVINKYRAGYTCVAGDYKSLAENIITMSSLNKIDLRELSLNSINCYKDNFEREMLINKIEASLQQITKSNINTTCTEY